MPKTSSLPLEHDSEERKGYGSQPCLLSHAEATPSAPRTPRQAANARPLAALACGAAGIALVAVAWPASWLQLGLLGEYSFFPLWLGYVLIVDGLVQARKRTSPLVRNPVTFGGMFLASVPLWWTFEGINYFTQNWHYVGAQDYSALEYTLIASWHFSIVVPAVLETAELLGSFDLIGRFQRGPRLRVTDTGLAALVALGMLSLGATLLWPQYVFPAAWICLFLVLDPINCRTGRPSILGSLRYGDWRPVVALGVGALICGWFWEMWNYWAFPKWEYTLTLVDFARVFEMPALGYAGYLPFGLEVYAFYHFLGGLFSLRLKGRGVKTSHLRSVLVRSSGASRL